MSHRLSTSRCMAIRVSASRALNGSSSSSRLGSRTSARASDARCASPPDSVSGHAPARPVRPTSASAPAALAPGSAARSPRLTLALTRRHGTRRGSWNAMETVPSTASSPVTSWSRPASARSRSTCPNRCARSARRTRRAAMSRSRLSRTGSPGPKDRDRPRTRTVGPVPGPVRRGRLRAWPARQRGHAATKLRRHRSALPSSRRTSQSVISPRTQ